MCPCPSGTYPQANGDVIGERQTLCKRKKRSVSNVQTSPAGPDEPIQGGSELLEIRQPAERVRVNHSLTSEGPTLLLS